MPLNNIQKKNCLICATDEGIFLNIFQSDKNFRNNIETCFSLKVTKTKVSSECICHKCAFEIENCTRFVERYKKSKQLQQGGSSRSRGRCRLCLEPGRKGYIYSLHAEAPLHTAIKKIEKIFDDDNVAIEGESSVCLDCRYNLDVLFDLKKIFTETSSSNFEMVFKGKNSSSKLPKIKTNVVKRKTTSIEPAPISLLTSIDDEAYSKRMTKRKVDSGPSKIKPQSIVNDRKCDECSCLIEMSKDIYKVHSTGQTYCHTCWPIQQEKKSSKNIKHNVSNNIKDTKDCSVFLKDVLTTHNLPDTKNKFFLKSEVDSNGTCTYIISDESETDDKPTASKKTEKKTSKRSFSEPECKPQKKMKKESDGPLRRSTRAASVMPEYIPEQKKPTKRRVSETAASEIKIEKGKSPKKYPKVDLSVSKTSDDGSVEKKGSKSNLKSKTTVAESAKSKKRIRARSNSSSSSSSSGKKTLPQKISENINNADTALDSDGDGNHPHTCSICSAVFENRVVGKTHELTHSKKLGVILEKVPVPELTENVIEKEIEEDENDRSKIDSEAGIEIEKIPLESSDVRVATDDNPVIVNETKCEEEKNESTKCGSDESELKKNETLDVTNEVNPQENNDESENTDVGPEKILIDSEVPLIVEKIVQEISEQQETRNDEQVPTIESEPSIIEDGNSQKENIECIISAEKPEKECEKLEEIIAERNDEKIVENIEEDAIADNKPTDDDEKTESNDKSESLVETVNDEEVGVVEVVPNREIAISPSNLLESKEDEIIKEDECVENLIEAESNSHVLNTTEEKTLNGENDIENRLGDEGLLEDENNQQNSETTVQIMTEPCAEKDILELSMAESETIDDTKKLIEDKTEEIPLPECSANEELPASEEQTEDLTEQVDMSSLDPLLNQMG